MLFLSLLNRKKKVLRLVPGDKDATSKLSYVEKEIRRIAFENAIATEAAKPLSETINVNEFGMFHKSSFTCKCYYLLLLLLLLHVCVDTVTAVESDYSGPRLEDEQPITLEFVQQMLEHFKEQKLIHRKVL